MCVQLNPAGIINTCIKHATVWHAAAKQQKYYIPQSNYFTMHKGIVKTKKKKREEKCKNNIALTARNRSKEKT